MALLILLSQEASKDIEYTVTTKPADAAIIVSTCPKEENDKILTVKITLTSPVIREEIMAINDKVKEETGDDTAAAAGE